MLTIKNLPIKKKLVLIFIGFILITTGYLLLDNHFQSKRKKLDLSLNKIYDLEVQINQMLYYQNEFLLEGLIDPLFFETGKCPPLIKSDSLKALIMSSIDKLNQSHFIHSYEHLKARLATLHKDIEKLSGTLDNITMVSLQRGFKAYGQEGQMRQYAHEIENRFNHLIELSDLLLLRRHEKDYFLRKDNAYVVKFDRQYDKILKSLITGADSKEQQKIVELLLAYQNKFHQVVKSEETIGFKDKTGLRAELKHLTQKVNAGLKVIKRDTQDQSEMIFNDYNNYLKIGLIGYFSILILLSLFLAEKLTQRLRYVTDSINLFVQSDFEKTTLFSNEIGKDEIGNLAKNFQILEHEISVHFKNFRESTIKKEREILEKNAILEDAHTLIKQQNKDILDSIKYAERIQTSILPSPTNINRLLHEHFVIYRPKDIVSGDFYWIENFRGKLFVCLADCTGHGVPGAFMSLIGHNHLNQAVFEKNLFEPDLILSYMNIAIMATLEKNRQSQIVRDGMDMALICVDLETSELSFSGAQRPLIIIRDNELIEFKGHRMPVGGFISSNVQYPMDRIQLEKGDQIYMFTDGYTDQFGGPDRAGKGKKFKTIQLKNLLYSIRKDNMKTQKELLTEAFDLWKGNHDQIDDVSLIGFKV